MTAMAWGQLRTAGLAIPPVLAPVVLRADVVEEAYRYKPFLTPMPVWGDAAWPWLLLPLCLAVAVVYKSIKCRTMRQVPREATILTIWIVAGMAVAAFVLAMVVEGLERANI